jgi:hypothetical protein
VHRTQEVEVDDESREASTLGQAQKA